MPLPSKITASGATYIKLGVAGSWEQRALAEGILRVDYAAIPHELAQRDDRLAMRACYKHKKTGVASRFANQLAEFYQAPANRLWITFADGYLYWAFAEPQVIYQPSDPITGQPSRFRSTADGWHRTSLAGKKLLIADLRGSLTKTRAGRNAIVTLQPDEVAYLLRVINDEEQHAITQAKTAMAELMAACEQLIRGLQPDDFETLVDMLFARAGWQHQGIVGGSQKTLDLELIQPIIRKRVLVQVKSTTDQAELDGYIDQLARRPEHEMFYVYHTSKKPLQAGSGKVTLIDAPALATHVVAGGLVEWLMTKSG